MLIMKKTLLCNTKSSFTAAIYATLLLSNITTILFTSSANAEVLSNLESSIAEPDNSSFGPFFGQQFGEPNFKQLTAVSSENLNLIIIQQHLDNNIRSARWKTVFSPTSTAVYTFNLPKGFNIFVNNQKLENQTSNFTAQQKYDLFIIAPDLKKIDLNNFTDISFSNTNGETHLLDKSFIFEPKNKTFTTQHVIYVQKKYSQYLQHCP